MKSLPTILALVLGKKADKNTYYSPDINYLWNCNVYLSKNNSIAVGTVKWTHLLQILKYRIFGA